MRLRSSCAGLSVVALLLANGITPSQCFGTEARGRATTAITKEYGEKVVSSTTSTRRYFKNIIHDHFRSSPADVASPLSQIYLTAPTRGSKTAAISSFEPQSTEEKMPAWLSDPQGHLYEEFGRKLRSAMMNSFFTKRETKKLFIAIRQASYGDRNKMKGAAEFCLLLVETMELGLHTLLAAVYHYCSCVTTRERSICSGTFISSLENYKHDKLDTSEEELTIRIVNDAARLKQLEMGAHFAIQSSASGKSQRVTLDTKDSENLTQLLLAETKDWRALAIRSGASLYRLRGILKKIKQSPSQHSLTSQWTHVAREALHIYAPLASRLGMHRLKNELEGAAFHILYRRQYNTVNSLAREVRSSSSSSSIQNLQNKNKSLSRSGSCDGFVSHKTKAKSSRISTTTAASTTTSIDIAESMKNVLVEVKHEMMQMLQNDEIFSSLVRQFSVTARVKEPYSMWKKMLKYGYNHVLQVPDAVALRIVLEGRKVEDDESDSVTRARERALCYYAQKLCKEHWKPSKKDPRFRDFIEKPKPNGYQSLHYTASTNWGGETWSVEIQIRTNEMHKVAEFGFASHWDYKSQQKSVTNNNLSSTASATFNRRDEGIVLDHSMDTYLRKLQEWHWHMHAGAAVPVQLDNDIAIFTATDTATQSKKPFAYHSHTNLAKTRSRRSAGSTRSKQSQARAERIREKSKQLEPYLQAFTEAQSSLMRERVFVFCSSQYDGNSLQGKVLSLPNGACVLDALREAEKQFGVKLNKQDQIQKISCFNDGDTATFVTDILQNGDLLKIPAQTNTMVLTNTEKR